MEEENKGITLKEICRTIWLRKWVALIAAVAVALICSVSIYYGYNPHVSYYEMEFSLNLPGSSGSIVYIYPDGTQFHYTDITSSANLKKLSKDFPDIDVEKMADNGYIHIRRDITVTADSGEVSGVYREITYTISVRANCFAGESQAREFLIRLANTPADHLSIMKIDYGVYLPMALNAVDYETEIGYLKNQLDFLQKEYSKLIATYGGSFVGNYEEGSEDEGKTLLAYSSEVQAYSDSGVLDNLLTEVRGLGGSAPILKKDSVEECKKKYELDLAEVTVELESAETTLETLLNINKDESGNPTATTVVLDASVIKEQQDLVTTLANRKAILEAFSNGIVSDEFDEKIQAAYKAVETFTETYRDTSATVYQKASTVVYVQPSVVVQKGGMSLTNTLLLSAVIAIIVALIAAYVAGKYKLKSLKVAENIVKEEPLKEEISADNSSLDTDKKE